MTRKTAMLLVVGLVGCSSKAPTDESKADTRSTRPLLVVSYPPGEFISDQAKTDEIIYKVDGGIE